MGRNTEAFVERVGQNRLHKYKQLKELEQDCEATDAFFQLARYQVDPCRITRRKKSTCKGCCYFREKKDLSAYRKNECALCGFETWHPSVHAPVICSACAQPRKLCTYCGDGLD